MTSAKGVCVLAIACLTAVSAFSISYTPHSRGRKLFGGYRIVPKVCQPTNPSRIKSNEPSICMFNYECSRRNGEVVGACMDGFLFGACCQLPMKNLQISSNNANDSPSNTDNLDNLHEIDHVPDLPILLNPDGTPVGISISDVTGLTKNNIYSGSSNDLSNSPGIYTKITTLEPVRTTTSSDLKQSNENVNLSQLEADFPALLGQQEILDDLRLPGLITNANNDIQDHHHHHHHNHHNDNPINPVTTLLSPDQILQIADPVDQLPALFAQGLGQNNHTGADTILLNANGTRLDEKNNPDDHFKPQNSKNQTSNDDSTVSSVTTSNFHRTSQSPSSALSKSPNNEEDIESQTITTIKQYANLDRIMETTLGIDYTDIGSTVSRSPIRISSLSHYTNNNNNNNDDNTATTPMSTTRYDDDENDDLVRVPTITYDAQSGNKKNDVLDSEEIAINHILSILNATTPSGPNRITQQVANVDSSIQTWISINETSKPVSSRLPKPSTTTEMFPYTFYNHGRPTTYYHYDTHTSQSSDSSHSTPSSSYTSGSSYRPYNNEKFDTTTSYGSSTGNYGYTTPRPTINPPAPTVIVLGPLGTEYTTITTRKPSTRRPITKPTTRPTQIVTKLPTKDTTRPSNILTKVPTKDTTRPSNIVTQIPTKDTIRPSNVTKTPIIGTTITHNTSTIISTNSAATSSNNHVISTSYISVNLKENTSPKPSIEPLFHHVISETETEYQETSAATKRPSTIWTTLSTWSGKPSFHPKPSFSSNIVFPDSPQEPIHTLIFKETTTTTTTAPPPTTEKITKITEITQSPTNCDDETPAPDDLINFPPVRNPNLTQQEKPTLVENFNNTDFAEIDYINGNDIPTPSFIEDDVLTNKVDVFVHKIVESLGVNFQDLKDVVYTKKNDTITIAPTINTVTKKPPTKKPIVKPTTGKPLLGTSSRPITKKPTRPSVTQKPVEKPIVRPTKTTTTRPARPSSVVSSSVTKKPLSTTVTKRPKPTRKPTVTSTSTSTTTETVVIAQTESPIVEETDVSTEIQESTSDYRKECGVRPLIKRGRIVGGKGAKFGEWPWQVLVREATWLGLFTKNKCGGVLVTNNYVVTAAHCQPGFLATLVAVFGEFDISGELESKRSITRNVRRVIVNRAYNPATFENDLALLELEKPIPFDAHIVPICMPDDDADFTGRMATVTGWGRVKYNGGTPSVLQEVQVPVMENAVCQEMFRTAGHSKLILDSFLCAGYASGQKDSCEGDSGGPLMMEGPDGRWILVGTVSHGIKCAAPYLPGVYMRTTFFKPWLHSVTGV